MKLFDIVRLKSDRPDLGLTTKNEGTIVDIVVPDNAVFVEFFDENHETMIDALDIYNLEDLELVEKPRTRKFKDIDLSQY